MLVTLSLGYQTLFRVFVTVTRC